MGSDDEASPKATSAAPRCTDLSLDAPRFASVEDRNACGCKPADADE